MNSTDGKTSQNPSISWLWLALAIAAVFVVWYLFYFWMAINIPTWKEHFQFDAFSAASALFSGLAFAGLIYTIFLQRRDLAFQLEELQQTREELKGQKEQLAAQNATLQQQSFETRFFEWLKLHHEITNAIEEQFPHGIKKGRDCFEHFIGEIQTDYLMFLREKALDPIKEQKWGESIPQMWERLRNSTGMTITAIAIAVYERTYSRKIQGNVGHYFRNLYNIVKFIHNSDLSQRTKRGYTNIVRAQLSSYELALLFYNCLAPQGNEKFKPLIEQYGLLKNMDKSLLLDPNLIENYANGAFQGTPAIFVDNS